MTACYLVAGVALLGNESSGCHSKGDIKEEIEYILFINMSIDKYGSKRAADYVCYI